MAPIVFGLTGIDLWYKLTRRHWVGWVALAFSRGYAVGSVLYLFYSRYPL